MEGQLGRNAARWIVALGAVIGVLVVVASGAGVFLRGDLATTTFVSLRGEHVDALVAGVYQLNAKPIAAEGVGWDFVTLFAVMPGLVLAMVALWRGSLRGALAATGIFAYFLYQYFEYAVFLAYGPLFLVYVGIFALSLSAIGLLVAQVGIGHLGERFGPGFPRRGVMTFAILMTVVLAGMWLPLIGRSVGQRVVEELDGATTLVVQAFDLGLLVPLAVFTAITVYRRLAIGYLLASVVVVKGMAMGTAIAAMLIFEWSATGSAQIVPAVGFALIAAFAAVLAWKVFASVSVTGASPEAVTRPRAATSAAH